MGCMVAWGAVASLAEGAASVAGGAASLVAGGVAGGAAFWSLGVGTAAGAAEPVDDCDSSELDCGWLGVPAGGLACMLSWATAAPPTSAAAANTATARPGSFMISFPSQGWPAPGGNGAPSARYSYPQTWKTTIAKREERRSEGVASRPCGVGPPTNGPESEGDGRGLAPRPPVGLTRPVKKAISAARRCALQELGAQRQPLPDPCPATVQVNQAGRSSLAP